jgi:thiamine transporter
MKGSPLVMFENLVSSMNGMLAHPACFFTLIAVLLFILGGLYIQHVKLTTRTLVYIALMLALSLILHQLRLYHMPQGGSITCGAMVPLLFISYRYGPGIGCLSGFLYGIINMMQDPFFLHPLQILFDYPLPYMVLGLAAILPAHRFISTALAFAARFACHFISGAVFFGSYAPAGTSPYFYSLAFNASYLLPEFLICFFLLKILPVRRILAAMERN